MACTQIGTAESTRDRSERSRIRAIWSPRFGPPNGSEQRAVRGVRGEVGAARLKNFRLASRKSALRMLCTVMDRGRSEIERLGAGVEAGVRCAFGPGLGVVARVRRRPTRSGGRGRTARVREIGSSVGHLYRVGRRLAVRTETKADQIERLVENGDTQ